MALGLKRSKLIEEKSESDGITDTQIKLVDKTNEKAAKSDETIKRKLIAYHKINELYHHSGGNPATLMRDFLDLAVDVLDATGGSLWTHDEGRKVLICQSATGPGAKELLGKQTPVGSEIVGWVTEKKKGTLIKDTAKDPRCTEIEKYHSILACPLLYDGHVLGVIQVFDRKEEASRGAEFSQADLSFMNSLCVPVAQNIYTTSLLSDQSRLIKRLEVLKDLQEAFGTTMELKPLLELVMSRCIELLQAEVGSIWLREETGEGIQCLVAHGPTKDKVVGAKVKEGAGIVGWVVANSQSSLVSDCSTDDRFSTALDKRNNFVTRSMIAAPLSVKGECIGAIQIINKTDSNLHFNESDVDYLKLIAANAVMFIKNARLFAAEKKAKELSALLEISQSITSTLDLDSVLMSIVNLSSNVIPYDRAVMSTIRRGTVDQLQVRAVTGMDRIHDNTPEAMSLNAIHSACGSFKEEISVMSLASIETQTQIPIAVKNYMIQKGLESFWACVLKDDQGMLGVLSMEAKIPHLIPPGCKELLNILVNQSTVALRNADLYSSVPSGAHFGSLKSKALGFFTNIRGWSVRRHATVWGTACVSILSLIFIEVPHSVSSAVEIVPLAETYYAESQGKIKQILVSEGQEVEAGDLLAKLDVSDLLMQKSEKLASRSRIFAEMIRLTTEDKVAEASMKANEIKSLDLEIERLSSQITKSEIHATTAGTVLSEKLFDLIGKPVSYGQEIIKLARMDVVIAEFKIPEEDVVFVKPKQEIQFKVFGHPQITFKEGLKLSSVAGEGIAASETDRTKFFTARARIPNSKESLLRPGMTGRGRISGEKQALWYVLLEKPMRFIINKLIF